MEGANEASCEKLFYTWTWKENIELAIQREPEQCDDGCCSMLFTYFASFMSCSYACYVWKTLIEAPDCFCITISSHKWALSGHFSTQFWEPMIVLWALAGNFPTIWNGHYCCLNSKLHQGQWVQWHVIMVKYSVQVSMYMLELIIFYRQWIAHVNYTYFMMDSCVMEPWGDN